MTPTQRPSIRRPISLVAASLLVLAAAVPAAGTTAGINGRISFSRFVEATASLEIFTARADGSDIQQLTNSGFDRVSESSDWSPNGSSIAFESDRVDSDGNTDTVQVYVMPWNGGPPTQLTTGPGFHHSNWLWVPAHYPPETPDGVFNCDERVFYVVGNLFDRTLDAAHDR